MNLSLIRQATNAQLMGNFIASPRRASPCIPKDVGCPRAKEHYNYDGQCVDCLLPACLEDEKQMPAIVTQRHTWVAHMVDYGTSAEEIASRLDISVRAVRRIMKRIR